jgi:large conductance mechanosensitive channel
MFAEFKKFLISGNMMDMAVGFIFGAAFATVVKSFVSNVIMPPIGMILNGVDFSELFIALDGNNYESIAKLEEAGAPAIKYGLFFNDMISFIILGFIVFLAIKAYNKLLVPETKDVPPEPTIKVCKECAMEIPIGAKMCGYCGVKCQ